MLRRLFSLGLVIVLLSSFLVACFNARTRNVYEPLLQLGGNLIGIGLEDLFGLSVAFSSSGDILEIEQYQLTSLSDKEATVFLTLHFESGSSELTEELHLRLVKEQDGWYVTP